MMTPIEGGSGSSGNTGIIISTSNNNVTSTQNTYDDLFPALPESSTPSIHNVQSEARPMRIERTLVTQVKSKIKIYIIANNFFISMFIH